MLYLISQKRRLKIRNYSAWIMTAIFTLMLILIILGCTGHENPFDPKNEQTKGKPFNLQAKPYFGRIDLEWEPLRLYNQDGKPGTLMDIDYYQIYRKTGDENWATLDTTSKTSYQDTNVVYKKIYNYKITAIRNAEESDSSDHKSQQAFWYPDTSCELDIPDGFHDPVDIAFCPFCNRYYAVCNGYYWDSGFKYFVFVLDQDGRMIDQISVGNRPIALDFWHNDIADRDTLIICNYSDKSFSVITEDNSSQFKEIQRVLIGESPLSVQVSEFSRKAYISLEGLDSIKVVDLKNLEYMESRFVGGSYKRLLLINESGPLLGVNEIEDKIGIIDIKSWNVDYVTVEDKPSDITIVPGSNLAYVACEYSFKVDEVKICAIDFETRSRVPDREFILMPDGWENHPISVTIIPGGLDDGLLFVAVWSGNSLPEVTRVFGYHIGPGIKELISIKEISNDKPRLIRALPGLSQEKSLELFILHRSGLHVYK